jgi:hypothetical protein
MPYEQLPTFAAIPIQTRAPQEQFTVTEKTVYRQPKIPTSRIA